MSIPVEMPSLWLSLSLNLPIRLAGAGMRGLNDLHVLRDQGQILVTQTQTLLAQAWWGVWWALCCIRSQIIIISSVVSLLSSYSGHTKVSTRFRFRFRFKRHSLHIHSRFRFNMLVSDSFQIRFRFVSDSFQIRFTFISDSV